MNNWVNFIIESGTSLSFLAMVYFLFLRKETFFRTNRIFLLVSVFFSLVVPFIRIPIFSAPVYMLDEVTVTPGYYLLETVVVTGKGVSKSLETTISSSTLIIGLYFAGTAAFLLAFIIRSVRLWLLIRKSEVFKFKGYKLVYVDKKISPFSFGKYVFVSRDFESVEGNQRMLHHELEHVRQGHTFDILILEIILVFQWFNPFMWLLCRSIRENHEYLADKAVLSGGIMPGEYKKMLLNQSFGTQLFATSHFNYSLIKKRIKMMSRKSSRFSVMKISLGIIAAVALVVFFACEHPEKVVSQNAEEPETEGKSFFVISGDSLIIKGDSAEIEKMKPFFSEAKILEMTDSEKGTSYLLVQKSNLPKQQPDTQIKVVAISKANQEDDSKIMNFAEEMPDFPGGYVSMMKFLQDNLHYPPNAAEDGISGKVYVGFVVERDGSVTDVKITRGVEASLDAEAIRVVKIMPKWKPGKQGGKPVRVSYSIPVNFILQ